MNSITTTISTGVATKPHPQQKYLDQYIKTLDEKELKAYHIARDHLGMSFQLDKSNGYLNWKKDNVKS
jgi:hypothetical protein